MFFYEDRADIERDMFALEAGVTHSYPMHLHRWYELVLVLDGELEIIHNGTSRTLHAKDTLFIFPNQPHQYIIHTECRHKLCLFKPELIAYFNTRIKGTVPREPKKQIDDDAWISMFTALSPTDPIERVKGVLYTYCGFFDSDDFVSVAESGIPDDLDLIHRIFVYAGDHYTESCTLSDLASGIGYDYSYLSKFFSEKIGTSFTEYVNSLRLDRARYLLSNTSMSILDISESCGYGSLRSFNRNFVRCVGVSPRDFRKG